jgi:hypothetical protein
MLIFVFININEKAIPIATSLAEVATPADKAERK